MSIWFFINLVIFTFALWKVVGHIHIHTIIGLFGLTFILYNWTRHAMFSTIRSNISRKRKIKFANISKTLLPLHKWTGTSALLFVLLHFVLIFYFFGFVPNTKMISGLLALFTLIGVVAFGWLRYVRTTVVRRYIHWTLAYILIFLVMFHILV